MKTATTIDEQIEILKERGISIENEQKAKENLLDIGYFRLGFYCFPFEESYPDKKNRTHKFKRETTFENIVKLYYFDVDLRNLFSRYIYRIEINFRTKIIYSISNEYKNSPTWFADSNIVNNHYAKSFNEKVYTDSFKKNYIIKHHHKSYINDIYAPAWKTLEFMTFGNIITLFQNIKDEKLKIHIAKDYGFKSVSVFLNYLETLRVIRNECAHNGVLFDISLPKSIMDGPAGKIGSNKNNLCGVILVIKYMLGRVSKNRATDLENKINELFSSIPPELQKITNNCTGYIKK